MFPLHDDNPTEITPVITVLLIISCVAVFIWEISLGENGQQAIYQFGAIPAAVIGGKSIPHNIAIIPEWMTVLTSMFLHGGWMHLIGNMLYLWIFGNNIEDAMGHGKFLLFYIACGVIAFLAHAYPDPQSVIPTVGASGAISGVLGAYLLLYPRAKVLVVIPIFILIHTTRISAAYVLGFWFILQLINSAASGSEASGVAWGAHIGGFIAGIILLPLFKNKRVAYFNPGH